MSLFALLALLVLFVAASLEIGGDVAIGKAIQTKSVWLALGGAALLIAYGAIVNLYNVLQQREGKELDFTRMLGVYIACFAVTNVLIDVMRGKDVPNATIAGTIVIAVGGAIIHWAGPLLNR